MEISVEQEPSRFSLNSKKEFEIKLFCDVASANGSLITVRELISLASLDASEEELENAWGSSATLRSHYIVDSGVVYERNEKKSREAAKFEELERRARADSNVYFAQWFSNISKDKNTLVISISGSTSYRSVSREDDLDFFCIAKKQTMWIFLAKALLLARAFRLMVRNSPKLCLSYVVDEQYALAEFGRPQDALFARDAISTSVLHGETYYLGLIGRSGWIARYFPKLYTSRTRKGGEMTRYQSPSTVEIIADHFLYFTVGSWIKLKSYLLNRRFASHRKYDSLFQVRIGEGCCVYESQSYLNLREMYSNIDTLVEVK